MIPLLAKASTSCAQVIALIFGLLAASGGAMVFLCVVAQIQSALTQGLGD